MARQKPADPPVVVIYDRVASRTARSRAALELRLRSCAQYAQEQRWQIGGWYLDSGDDALSDLKRPALDQALRMMQRMPRDQVRYLLVHGWDRLSRNGCAQQIICHRVRLAYGQICTPAGPVDELARRGHPRDLAAAL